MRLQGVFDGRLYATDDREVFFERSDLGFDSVGRLPPPPANHASWRDRLQSTHTWKSVIERVVGAFSVVTVHRLTREDLLATAGSWLFTSHDAGRHWHLRRQLPRSSGPMGVLPTGVCYHDGSVYLGEYPLAAGAQPRILRSEDRGRTWTTELVLEGVRHVHAIQVDPYTGERWVTTGDADSECHIGQLKDGELAVIGGGSQRWRAVELAFTPSAVLWGVDCVYAASNPILKLDREDLHSPRPLPTVVHELDDSVFYAATLSVDSQEWVIFSTAAEVIPDSSAPHAGIAGTGTVAVVASSSASGYTEWFELARYPKRRRPVDWFNPGRRIPNASAYAFLASHPERGLFINPYNTEVEGGAIVRFPPAAFDRLGRYR